MLSLSAGEIKDSEHFLYAEETKLAWETGKLSADITEEQRKLTEADLVIFQVQLRKRLNVSMEVIMCVFSLCMQFPMYWFSVPAIMKGWIDRVLTRGYAFSEEMPYSQGVFKVKCINCKNWLNEEPH